jgi:hypothetical protein
MHLASQPERRRACVRALPWLGFRGTLIASRRAMNRRPIQAAFSAAVLLAAGCGASGRAAASAPGRSACDLECQRQEEACEATCHPKPDDTGSCAVRCGDARARCLSQCEPKER